MWRKPQTNLPYGICLMEAAPGIEPGNGGFANRCLTAWLYRPIYQSCDLYIIWRRERDSNSREGLPPPTGLAIPPLQPLGYLSTAATNNHLQIATEF